MLGLFKNKIVLTLIITGGVIVTGYILHLHTSKQYVTAELQMKKVIIKTQKFNKITDKASITNDTAFELTDKAVKDLDHTVVDLHEEYIDTDFGKTYEFGN